MKNFRAVISCVICAVMMILCMFACDDQDGQKDTKSVIDSMTLEDIVSKVYETSGLPKDFYQYYVTNKIDKESNEYFFGADIEYTEAVYSEPEIGYGYSFCLVRVEEGKAEEVEAIISKNANLNKWVCVSAEAKVTAANGNVVLLCMAAQTSCDALKTAFLNIK